MEKLRFGTFIPPIHPVYENPTLCLERDLDLIEHMDKLGFDEAWFGEHHSAGTELYSTPEFMILAAHYRTKRIRLGTGVSSLPYHHPLILADRFMQLHHMTQGRAMFGCGPGALVSDAKMMGIETSKQRDMMEEALEDILKLFRGETVTNETSWYTLKDARLQLRPYSNESIEVVTASMMSPSGPRAAGRLGTGLLSMSASAAPALKAAGTNWDIACDIASQYGNTMDRSQWRMIGLFHIAETKEQAIKDVQFGIEDWVQYFEDVAVLPMVPPERRGDPVGHLMDTGHAAIGTPDDVIRQIETIWESSDGGFGCFLSTDHSWADTPAKHKSYEMMARYVFPHFKNHNIKRKESNEWVKNSQEDFKKSHFKATDQQIEKYNKELQSNQKSAPVE
ncbi:MAG: LLM class flavin-dependent oxidoreductase [Rhodospirillaceae bacterium]